MLDSNICTAASVNLQFSCGVLYKTKKTGRSKMVKLGILGSKLQFQLMLYLTTWALWVHRCIQVLSLDGIYDSWRHHLIDMMDYRFRWTQGVFSKQAKKT